MNCNLRKIQNDKLNTDLNLTYYKNFTHLIRNDKDIYHFGQGESRKIRDIYQKVNFYNKKFLF